MSDLGIQPTRGNAGAVRVMAAVLLAVSVWTAGAPAGAPPNTPASALSQASGEQTTAAPSSAPSSDAAATDSSEKIDGIAAVVGPDVVLLSELEQQSFFAATQAGVDPADTAQARTIRHDVLDRLINEKIVLQEASHQSVTVPDSEVTKQAREELKNIRQRFPDEKAYQNELLAEGTTESGLLIRFSADVRRQLLAQTLIAREVQSRIEVTDQDVTDYYAKNKDTLPKRPATVRLSQLVVVPTVAQDVEDRTREKALALLARLRSGEDFAALARQVSGDSASARQGGDLGWFGHGEMDRAFEGTAFSLDAGHVGGPVRTRYGYHLIQVDEKDADRVHARHILFRVSPTPADVARARKQIDALRLRVAAGESFSALASAYSADPGSRDKGGDLGEIPMAQLDAKLRAQIDTLPIARVSRVLSEDNVFYLFLVSGRRLEAAYDFDEIKGDLRDLARQEKTQALYQKWVADLRAKVYIEVKPRAEG